jgi:tRNA-Thr(GGU) m(6)t(6)A37 methyltransferase TsaA
VTTYELKVVGRVESSLKDPADAPRQADEGAPEAWLVFDREMLPALDGTRPGSEAILITWLDRASRDVLQNHPRRDPSRPMQGVFSTRSPNRPNPLGLHRVHILAVDGERVHVRALEAVDGTPIVDMKTVLHEDIALR